MDHRAAVGDRMINVLHNSNNPQKFLILYDVTQEQWEQATKARKADLIAEGCVRYGGIEVLTSLIEEVESDE